MSVADIATELQDKSNFSEAEGIVFLGNFQPTILGAVCSSWCICRPCISSTLASRDKYHVLLISALSCRL
jgi:hypothetical protein